MKYTIAELTEYKNYNQSKSELESSLDHIEKAIKDLAKAGNSYNKQ